MALALMIQRIGNAHTSHQSPPEALIKTENHLDENGMTKELIVEDEKEFLQTVPCKERLRPLKKIEMYC